MSGDHYKILLIGCFLKKACASLEDHLGESLLSLVTELDGEGATIAECAMHLLKKENVNEEFKQNVESYNDSCYTLIVGNEALPRI